MKYYFSLDLLTTLNVLQQSLDSIDQDMEEEETFSSPSMLQICLDDQRLPAFPLGLNLRFVIKYLSDPKGTDLTVAFLLLLLLLQ